MKKWIVYAAVAALVGVAPATAQANDKSRRFSVG